MNADQAKRIKVRVSAQSMEELLALLAAAHEARYIPCRVCGAEAEVATLGRMLRLSFDELPDDGLDYSDVDYAMWLDGLRERAGGGE